MRTLILNTVLMLLTMAAVAAPQGRWAGPTSVPGWPTLFTVVEFHGQRGEVSMLQANLLQSLMESPKFGPEGFSFDLNAYGVVYRFDGSGEDILSGSVAPVQDPSTASGDFRWMPHPVVATMPGFRSYSGSLRIEGVASVDMVIDYAVGSDDRLHADISIPIQKLDSFPLEVRSKTADSAELVLASSVPATITLPLGGEEITAGFKQGGFSAEIAMVRTAEPARTLRRPQDPTPPLPYELRDVLLQHPDGHSLAGTLTVPVDGEGPHPAVVLISGSGAQNRNEEIMGHRPFLVLSDHLTRQGIAVLRFDDRGVGGSVVPDQRMLLDDTSLDFASDVSLLVDHLKTQPGIDSDRIGLVGHSEGGIIAPIIADRRNDIAFVVLMAAPARSGLRLLPDQSAALMRASGIDESVIDAIVAEQTNVLRKVTEGASLKELREPIRRLSVLQTDAMNIDIEIDDEFIDNAIASTTIPWIRWFLAHDPAPVLKRLDMPVYAINGSLDLQVPASSELTLIQEVMVESDRDVTTRLYPGLNHLFQPATTGAVEEYAEIETTLDPQVLRDMSEWIRERMNRDE